MNRKIGFCIYCGSKKELSDEHVIPFALNGGHTLSLASCENCRKITNSFEAPLLSGLLKDYRVFNQFKSRTKHNNFNPTKKYLVKTDENIIENKDLHLNQTGLFLFLPEFYPPKFLTKDLTPGVKLKRFCTFTAKAKPENIPKDLKEFRFKQNFPTSNFIRLLCKIGLGCVYLNKLESNFHSYVTNLILENKLEDWKFVGSPEKSLFKDDESGIKFLRKDNLLMAEIKLFDDMLARYNVVVGYFKK